MNDLTTPPSKLSIAYSATADLAVELGRLLALVAPTSMTAEQQETWLRAAMSSLNEIRPDEIKSVSVEVARSVTRPSQIVPEIAKLVAEKRKRSAATAQPKSPFAAKKAIYEKADAMRAEAAKRKDQRARNREMEEAFRWERQALQAAGFEVGPLPLPLGRDELDAMPSHIRNMGLSAGFLEYRDGILMEVRV